MPCCDTYIPVHRQTFFQLNIPAGDGVATTSFDDSDAELFGDIDVDAEELFADNQEELFPQFVPNEEGVEYTLPDGVPTLVRMHLDEAEHRYLPMCVVSMCLFVMCGPEVANRCTTLDSCALYRSPCHARLCSVYTACICDRYVLEWLLPDRRLEVPADQDLYVAASYLVEYCAQRPLMEITTA